MSHIKRRKEDKENKGEEKGREENKEKEEKVKKKKETCRCYRWQEQHQVSDKGVRGGAGNVSE